MIGGGIGITPMGGSSSSGSSSGTPQQTVCLKGQLTPVVTISGMLLKC